MTTDTADKILFFIKAQKRVSPKEIIEHLGFSRQAVYKQLAKLLEQDIIYKIGKPPKVFYVLTGKKEDEKEYNIPQDIKDFIDKEFLDITVDGREVSGWGAFVDWCLKRGQNIERSAIDYVKIIRKYNSIKKDSLIDGMVKMKSTFSNVYLDNLFYLDFYSIERFGKTKLGKFLLYAKQSQDKKLIKRLSIEIKPKIKALIKLFQIDAVIFVPPTVKRETQLMKELEKNLNLKTNIIKVAKIKTPIIIPQKTLNKLEERIENAKKTFVVEATKNYKNVLIIDDAVGSGATLNEIAFQIKEKKIVRNKIIGLAITGSLKGFDVVSEV
ncbi:MAG: HTH domain-containing protein [bacterium]